MSKDHKRRALEAIDKVLAYDYDNIVGTTALKEIQAILEEGDIGWVMSPDFIEKVVGRGRFSGGLKRLEEAFTEIKQEYQELEKLNDTRDNIKTLEKRAKMTGEKYLIPKAKAVASMAEDVRIQRRGVLRTFMPIEERVRSYHRVIGSERRIFKKEILNHMEKVIDHVKVSPPPGSERVSLKDIPRKPAGIPIGYREETRVEVEQQQRELEDFFLRQENPEDYEDYDLKEDEDRREELDEDFSR